MTTFDTVLVGRWFELLLDPDLSAQDSATLRLTAAERRVMEQGRAAVAAAVGESELPIRPVPPADPAAAILQVYLTGLATGIAGARRRLAESGELDEVVMADRLCLVAGLIAGGAAVQVAAIDTTHAQDAPGGRGQRGPGPADLARVAGTTAAELVVDGSDLPSITAAAAAVAMASGAPDGANHQSGYRSRALIGVVLAALHRSTAPAGSITPPPSCGARPGANIGQSLLAEVTFTMFVPQLDSDRIEAGLAAVSEEVVIWSEGDRRYFHLHTRHPGEAVSEAYASGAVFSLVIGRLE